MVPVPALAAQDIDVLVLFASGVHTYSIPVGPYVTVVVEGAVPGGPKPVPRNVITAVGPGAPAPQPPAFAGIALPPTMDVMFGGTNPSDVSGRETA